jgi:hypothetical protein
MAKAPESSETPRDQATAPETAGDISARAARAKPAIAIDLPPSAVTETKEQTATSAPAKASSIDGSESKTAASKSADGKITEPKGAAGKPDQAPAPQSNAPAKTKTPLAVPALLGLIAGGVGGFGAWHVTDYFSPRVQRPSPAIESRLTAIEQGVRSGTGEIPQALIDRLSRAEAGLQAADQREKALRDEIGKLSTGLTQEAGERTKALAALSAAAGASPAPAAQLIIPVPDANKEVEQLKARLGSVESAAGALPTAIGTVSAKADSVASRIETLAPRLDQVNIRVETLAPKLDAVGEQVSSLGKTVSALANRDSLSRGAALVTAVGLLTDALERGQALGQSAGILRSLGLSTDALAPFAPYTTEAAPSATTLLAELRAIKPPQAAASTTTDIMERLKQGVSSFVEVRRTGQVTGTDDPSQIAIAEQALQRGDFGAAITAIGRLSAERAPHYAAWRARAEQRLKAMDAATKLKRDAFAALNDAASGATKP